MTCGTLPELFSIDKLDENEGSYLHDLFYRFYRTYIENGLIFNGKIIALMKYRPNYDEYSSFHHLVSESYELDHSNSEDDRIICPNRCERIFWIKPILESCAISHCKDIRIWKKEERGKKTLIYCVNERYLIVLLEKDYVFHLLSAYPIDENHTHQKLLREFKFYDAKNAQSS